MIVPGQNHRDPWFAPFFKGVLEDTKYLFRTTSGTPFIFSGTGTGGWEASLSNTLSPGDKARTPQPSQVKVFIGAVWRPMQP
jgi:alanine-glyoxylate transaminase/serine-glyoxylate transaminase/serine-pyruvate transaminase